MDMDIKTADLGHTFSYRELRNQCKAVWGGVAWPGKRPGFAVVVGMGQDRHFDSYDVYLLDEYESFDMRQLVRQCGALDLKYCISLNGSHGPDCSGRWQLIRRRVVFSRRFYRRFAQYASRTTQYDENKRDILFFTG